MEPSIRTDTRRFPRVVAKHLMTFSRAPFEGFPEPATRLGRTLDLSETGVRFETSRRLQVGDRLELEIALGDEILETAARVIYVVPRDHHRFIVGLRLINPPDSHRRTLRALVN